MVQSEWFAGLWGIGHGKRERGEWCTRHGLLGMVLARGHGSQGLVHGE